MLARSTTFALDLLDAVPVRVEADVRPGLPGLHLVGLGDAAVREARDRVQSAISNTGLTLPQRRIVVHLAPAWLRKRGSGFDLAIAVALLAASGKLDPRALDGWAAVGELSLAGELRPVAGVLAIAASAKAHGVRHLLCPVHSAAEAALIDGLDIAPVATLGEAIALLSGKRSLRAVPPPEPAAPESFAELSDVRGQPTAVRALEIAAAGRHNLLLMGPPGTGKTMLARRLPGLLPALDDEAALEVTRIRSATGRGRPGQLERVAPYRAPHHTVSAIGLVGGGTPPRAGELTLAHRGVLFLDELPEFSRGALEALRQPIEERHVALSRGGRAVVLPTDVQLVAAMNPCPCGNSGDACRCSPVDLSRYERRLSGPLLDRFDLHCPVGRPSETALATPSPTTADVAARVLVARERQLDRQQQLNVTMTGRSLRKASVADKEAIAMIDALERNGSASMRAVDRVLRVARTIADLRGAQRVERLDVAEALTLRYDTSVDQELAA